MSEISAISKVTSHAGSKHVTPGHTGETLKTNFLESPSNSELWDLEFLPEDTVTLTSQATTFLTRPPEPNRWDLKFPHMNFSSPDHPVHFAVSGNVGSLYADSDKNVGMTNGFMTGYVNVETGVTGISISTPGVVGVDFSVDQNGNKAVSPHVGIETGPVGFGLSAATDKGVTIYHAEGPIQYYDKNKRRKFLAT